MRALLSRANCHLWVMGLWISVLSTFGQLSLAQSLPSTQQLPVHKGDTDLREYRYLRLSNQLKVLLVSDPKVHLSTVALNVAVGHYHSPQQRPGLAHLLEHMLVLGSQKYPEVGEYQRFLAEQGGHSGSTTSEENTRYYFSVDHNQLDLALDRFADFFIAPSLDIAAIEQQRHRVTQDRMINTDELRRLDVYRSLLNPEHPAAKIHRDDGIGVVADQAPVPAKEHLNLHEELLLFYKNNYSANLMSLVVIGNQPLEDLQKMVEGRFALIANHNKALSINYPPLFAEGSLPLSVAVPSVTKSRQLSLAFPVANDPDTQATKSWRYIIELLSNDSPGSVLFLLKQLGWVETLTAEQLLTSKKDGLLQINMTLTAEGMRAKDQIVSAVFEYIGVIAHEGVNAWRYDELRQMGDLHFRFSEVADQMNAEELLQSMQIYAAKDVLRGVYVFPRFSEYSIKKALGYLRINNVVITCLGSDCTSPKDATPIATPDKTLFSLVAGIPNVLELKPAYRQKLSLPERNVFLPKNVTVKAPSVQLGQMDAAAKFNPTLLLNNDQLNVWFLQDHYYRSPRVELKLRFLLPALNNSLENTAYTELYVALVLAQLEEHYYSASLAGLTFSINANTRGFDVHIAGYADKHSLLVKKITDALTKMQVSKPQFDAVKGKLLSKWRQQNDSALVQTITRLQYQPAWTREEYASVLRNTPFATYKRFAENLLQGAKIEALFYGNFYSQDAIKLAGLIDYQFLKTKASYPLQPIKVLRTENKNGKPGFYNYRNNSNEQTLSLYIAAASVDIDSAAHTLLLNYILQPLFVQQSAVSEARALYSLPLHSLQSSLFVVNSSAMDTAQTMKNLDGFFQSAAGSITSNFTRNKISLLSQLREVPGSLSGQAEKFWQSILLNDKTFSRQQELIMAVSKISPESLLDYYQNTFLQGQHKLWLATEKINTVENFEIIQDVNRYRQEQRAYWFP